MGNGITTTTRSSRSGSSRPRAMSSKRTRRGQPRVVLESPEESKADNTKTTRVTFADRRSGLPVFNVRPQMTDVGKVDDDVTSKKVKRVFTRSQSMRAESNPDMRNSMTSMASLQSTRSMPVNGLWEPSIDPYERSEGGDRNNSFYTGFSDSGYSTRKSGLSTVTEI